LCRKAAVPGGNEKREWRIGEALVFDDSIEHEAWNGSGEPRYLLIFDIWNPLLSAAERELVGALLVAFEEYYGRQIDQVQTDRVQTDRVQTDQVQADQP